MTEVDASETIELVARRADVLERFADGPIEKREAVEELECSRSTLDRAVRALEDADLLTRENGGYTATIPGQLAAERYRSFVADEQSVLSACEALRPLSPDCTVPAALLSGATVTTVDKRRGELFDAFASRLQSAERYRACLPRLADVRHLRLVHALAVRSGLAVDLLLGERAMERLTTEFPHLAAGLADMSTCSIRVGDTPEYGLAVIERPADIVVSLLVYDGQRLHGTVHAEPGSATEWAGETVDMVYDNGVDATDRLRESTQGGDSPLLDAGLDGPARLAAAGFERVDAEYFARRTPNEPVAGWQVGFDLADLYYGNGFEWGLHNDHSGTDSEGVETASEYLVDHLRSGTDHVVLGPSGAGKSTVCRLTACRWIENGNGPVLYRQSPTDRELAAGPLFEAADDADGHVLIVVEDAAAVVHRLHDLIRRFRDRDDCSLLLEARETEWELSLESLDPRIQGTAHTALEEFRLPDIDESTCRQAISAFEAATGRSVPLSPSELRNRIRTENGIGETYLLGYTLTSVTASPTGTDPNTEPTALEADVQSVYEFLADVGDFEMAVGLLIAALTAADRTVARPLLHSVAAARVGETDGSDSASSDPDYEAHRRVASVLADLEGQMLFTVDDEYRTHHPYWAVRFLEHALERAERETVALFERAFSALLALSTHSDRRERIERWLGTDSQALDRLATAAGVDALAGAVFELGRQYSGLAPLFGTADRSGISLPETCSPELRLRVHSARLDAWYGYGDFERARREAERLREAAESAAVDSTVRARYLAASYSGLGDIANESGDLDTAIDRLQAGLEAIDTAEAPRATVALWNALARVALRDDRYDAAEEYLELARELEAEDVYRERAETAYNLGDLHRRRGEFETAERYLQEALELYDDLGLRKRAGAAYNLLGMIADDRERYQDAEGYYRRSLAAKRETRDRPAKTRVLFNLGATLMEQEQYESADDCFEESLELAETLEMDRFVGHIYEGRARMAYERGDLDLAREYHGRQRTVYEEFDFDRGIASCETQLGDIAREEGDLETAIEHYEEGYERFLAIDALRFATAAVERLVGVYDSLEDIETALEWCQRGLDLATEGDLDDRRETFERLERDLATTTKES